MIENFIYFKLLKIERLRKMVKTRYREEEIDIECPKCKMHSKVKVNNFFDSFYSCPNCKEVVNIPKLKD